VRRAGRDDGEGVAGVLALARSRAGAQAAMVSWKTWSAVGVGCAAVFAGLMTSQTGWAKLFRLILRAFIKVVLRAAAQTRLPFSSAAPRARHRAALRRSSTSR
jgi:hypothetical protein